MYALILGCGRMIKVEGWTNFYSRTVNSKEQNLRDGSPSTELEKVTLKSCS